MPAGRRLLSRRTTLVLGAGAGAAGLVAVAGCDDGPGPSGEPDATSTPAGDPDGDLVDAVLAALSDASETAGHVAARFPVLEDAMQRLRTVHDAHIEALEGTVPTQFAHSGVLAGPDAALSAVRRHEKRLQSLLVESAVAADSGALARLLASMSAAVTQQLTALPRAAT